MRPPRSLAVPLLTASLLLAPVPMASASAKAGATTLEDRAKALGMTCSQVTPTGSVAPTALTHHALLYAGRWAARSTASRRTAA